MKFDRNLGSAAVEVPVEFQGDWKKISYDFGLHENIYWCNSISSSWKYPLWTHLPVQSQDGV